MMFCSSIFSPLPRKNIYSSVVSRWKTSTRSWDCGSCTVIEKTNIWMTVWRATVLSLFSLHSVLTVSRELGHVWAETSYLVTLSLLLNNPKYFCAISLLKLKISYIILQSLTTLIGCIEKLSAQVLQKSFFCRFTRRFMSVIIIIIKLIQSNDKAKKLYLTNDLLTYFIAFMFVL